MKNILGERYHEVIEKMYWEDSRIIMICKSNLWRGKSKIIIENIVDDAGTVRLNIKVEELE